MSKLTDKLDAQAQERAEHAKELNEMGSLNTSAAPAGIPMNYVLYTYAPKSDGSFDCHAYGSENESTATEVGHRLQVADPHLGFTVAQPEQLSDKFPMAVDGQVYVLYYTVFGYGLSGSSHVALSTDPAALDALGKAKMAAGEDNSYMVVLLESMPS